MSRLQTLLVFELNPDDLHFYLVAPDSKQANIARILFGKMSGADAFSGREAAAFAEISEWFATEAGTAAKQTLPIHDVTISEVIHFGVYL